MRKSQRGQRSGKASCAFGAHPNRFALGWATLLIVVASGLSGAEGEFKQAIVSSEAPVEMWFPPDHASHAGFQTEWWYVTGNVKSDSGREFGYQFTIFRRAMDAKSPAERGRKSPWAIGDVYLGHLAVSDIDAKKLHFHENVQRGNVGLAGATDVSEHSSADTNTLQSKVWLANWSFTRFGDGAAKDSPRGWELKAREGDVEISLTLTETLAPILHGRDGEEGLSRKGPKDGQASFYYSVAGLQTRGSIRIGDSTHKIVSGRSWMDHEWGSNQLSQSQAGWDWFSIQLDGEKESGGVLMLYRLRHKDGSIEPASSGTWVSPDGKRTHLSLADIEYTPGRTWTSPTSGGQYPVEWSVAIPKLNLALKVTPAFDDQEVKTKGTAGMSYYEGAIRLSGKIGEKEVKGDGYLEITGAPGQKSSGRGLGGML